MEATEIVLNNNTFVFNNTHYEQNKGTAMGTKMAPTYATLTLGFLEENLYDNIATDFCSNLAENIKNTWKRYLDDWFIIWNQEILDLETFHELLNNINPDIKFTVEEIHLIFHFWIFV